MSERLRVRSSLRERAFTLIELLVVLAVIAALTAWMITGMRGSGGPAALRSAQAAWVKVVTLARTQALASGQPSRVLVHVDASSVILPSRYLRDCVVQTSVAGSWQTLGEFFLPDGVFVVPGDFASLPVGLFSEGASQWVRADGATALRSTVLRSNQIISEAIRSTTAEKWVAVSFSAVGTTSQSGDLVLASGRRRSEPVGAGESPIELVNPDAVCGLTLSAYGLAVLISDRTSF